MPLLLQVVTDPAVGLAFKNRRDGKVGMLLMSDTAALPSCWLPTQSSLLPLTAIPPACRHNAQCHATPPAGRQVIIVKPAAPSPGNYTTCTDVQTEEYEQAVIFDHVIGRCT